MALIDWLEEIIELLYEHFQAMMKAQLTFPSPALAL